MLSTIIKETTAPLHAQLEQALFSKAIMNGSLTLLDYNTVLRVNYLVHHLLEPILFEAVGADLRQKSELDKRRKLPALEKDMNAAGINLSKDHGWPVTCPVFNSESEALGGLYVLEGATLGGQVIVRQLQKNPLLSLMPLAYYNVYADRTGWMWKQFLAVINQCEDKDKVLAGAQKVYGLYLALARTITRA